MERKRGKRARGSDGNENDREAPRGIGKGSEPLAQLRCAGIRGDSSGRGFTGISGMVGRRSPGKWEEVIVGVSSSSPEKQGGTAPRAFPLAFGLVSCAAAVPVLPKRWRARRKTDSRCSRDNRRCRKSFDH